MKGAENLSFPPGNGTISREVAMPETFLETLFAARLAERIVLTLVILVAAVLVMRGFWRTMSRVDFDISKEKLGASVTIAS